MAEIWVVEDDNVVNQLVVSLLGNEGYQVFGFLNGTEVISRLEMSRFPDLIILDVLMPEKNGNDVMEVIRRMGKPKVVVLTACVSNLRADLASIPFEIVVKPFKYLDIMNTVKRALSS